MSLPGSSYSHSLRDFVYILWVWVGLFKSDETSLESGQFCLHQKSHPQFAYIRWDDKGLCALDESTWFCLDQMSHPAFVYIRWVSDIFYLRQMSHPRFVYIRRVSKGFLSFTLDESAWIYRHQISQPRSFVLFVFLHQMSPQGFVYISCVPGFVYRRWVCLGYFKFDESGRVCLHQGPNLSNWIKA